MIIVDILYFNYLVYVLCILYYFCEIREFMKYCLVKSVGFLLLLFVIVGCIFGFYYVFILDGNGLSIFFNLFVSVIVNVYIVGFIMVVFVVLGYLFMYKYVKVNYLGVLILGLLGGVIFSYLLSVIIGMVFVINVVMFVLVVGLFLFGLR